MSSLREKAGSLLPMMVTEGVTVNVLPSEQYEYLMTTTEVANGYGVTDYAIRKNKLSLSSELIEGKHFVIAKNFAVTNGNSNNITFGNSDYKIPHNAILWTKRGIVRLGFAMRSERAKLFRDWAEELIIRLDECRENIAVIKPKELPVVHRRHNRLTQDRLVNILADVCKIDDKELRLSITNKLMGGY
jgi:hypothetical protein